MSLTMINGNQYNVSGILRLTDEEAGYARGSARTQVELVARLIRDLAAENSALRAAAGKVTCKECAGLGVVHLSYASAFTPCPSCAALRALLNPQEHRPTKPTVTGSAVPAGSRAGRIGD